MQALSLTGPYVSGMAKSISVSRLRQLREAAGLTMRELARKIGEDHSNVRYWESSGKIPRSDVLLPIANALGVTVDELLGDQTAKRRTKASQSRLGQVFALAQQLPRKQQQKIAEVVEALVIQANASINKGQ